MHYPYSRFSSAAQASGDSETRQEESLQGWLTRHKVSPSDVGVPTVDRGLSGYKAAHLRDGGGLAGILASIESGTIKSGDVIVVEALDRLSRMKASIALEMILSILRHDISIAVAYGDYTITRRGFDSNDGSVYRLVGEITEAHRQSHVKSMRVASSWRSRRSAALKGVRTKHKHPAWLKWNAETNLYELIQERAETIRLIFQLSVRGDVRHDPPAPLGSNAIARQLNKDGVAAFGKQGWTTAYTQKILKSRAVLGEITMRVSDVDDDGYSVLDKHGRLQMSKFVAIPDYYPRVIDDATFALTSERMAAGSFWHGGSGDEVTNIFDGMIKCATCGEPLYIQSSRRVMKKTGRLKIYRYYRCRRSIDGGDCTNTLSYHVSLVEERVLRKMAGALVRRVASEATQPLIEQRDRLQGDQAVSKQKLTNLTNSLEDLDPLAQPAVKARIRELGEMVRSLEHQITGLSARIRRGQTYGPTPEEEADALALVDLALSGDHAARTMVKSRLRQFQILIVVSGNNSVVSSEGTVMTKVKLRV